MIFVFSILLYPIFFIIAYILGEYIFPTRNSAMIFSFFVALIFSFLYYTIRKRVRQLTEKKLQKKRSKESTLTALLLVDEKKFKDFFPKNSLADNSYNGVNEEKIIDHLRKNNGFIHVYSIKGMTEGAKDFLKLIKVDFLEHSNEEIIEMTKNITLPEIDINRKKPMLKRIKKSITSKEFKKFTLKYGVILLLLSLITPYKFYYIFFGSALIIYNLTFKIIKKINQRNQIPYPRS